MGKGKLEPTTCLFFRCPYDNQMENANVHSDCVANWDIMVVKFFD